MSAYTYDTVGNLDNVQTANGIRHHYTYDGLNRLTNLTIKNGSLNTVASYAYTLRASGHRSAVAEYSGRTTAYAYDALYRLTRETITADPQLPMGLADYSYDKVGNRLSRTATALGLTQQALSYTANDWLQNDTYDSNGNTLASGAWGTDTYDFKNRLLRRTLPNGNTIDLHYNAEGHRVRKSLKDAFGYTEQDTHYHTDTRNLTGYAQVLEELTSDGTSLPNVTKRYLYGLDLLAMDAWQSDTPSGGDWHLSYYLYDGHGNVRHLTNQQGQITDTYTYDAFGILLSRTGTTDNHYRYCGERYDSDLGMYYLRARYMNTETGRFWTMDSYEGRNSDPITLHKYLYANANPVMYVDPSGMYNMAGTIATTGVIGNITGIAKLATGVLIAAISSVIVKDFDKASDAIKEIARKLRRSKCSAIIGESVERVIWAKLTRYMMAEVFTLGNVYYDDLAGVNTRWIRNVMARNCTIIDIGIDPTRKVRGEYYKLELKETQFYPHKVFDYSIPGFRGSTK